MLDTAITDAVVGHPLLSRLAEVVDELMSLYDEARLSIVEERRAYNDAFQHSVETSIAGKTRDAEMQSYYALVAVQEVNAQIKGRVEERELIKEIMRCQPPLS